MKSLLIKELKLTAHPLTFFFLAFSVMALIPGYPILVGSFFVCFGIFQSFQQGREAHDVLYTVLLPIRKRDAVRARFLLVCFIEAIALLLMAILTAVRMTALSEAKVYTTNFMMNANLVYLAYTLLVFALFNATFVGPFFKTAYKFGKPFIVFVITSFVLICIAETLHHLPGLGFLNGVGRLGVQAAILAAAAVIFAAATGLSCSRAEKEFETIDL